MLQEKERKKGQVGWKAATCWEFPVSSPGSRGLQGQRHVSVFEGGPSTALMYPSLRRLPPRAVCNPTSCCTAQERWEQNSGGFGITLKIHRNFQEIKSFPLDIAWFVLWQHKGEAGQESKRVWFRNFFIPFVAFVSYFLGELLVTVPDLFLCCMSNHSKKKYI